MAHTNAEKRARRWKEESEEGGGQRAADKRKKAQGIYDVRRRKRWMSIIMGVFFVQLCSSLLFVSLRYGLDDAGYILLIASMVVAVQCVIDLNTWPNASRKSLWTVALRIAAVAIVYHALVSKGDIADLPKVFERIFAALSGRS